MIRIPAIDLYDGKVVRLKQGKYETARVYHDQPFDLAKGLAESGLPRLHVVDLNGARDGSLINVDLIRSIADQTMIEIQSGGGVRYVKDIEKLLSIGVKRVVSSSFALEKPEEWLEAIRTFGGESCIFGMDLKDNKIATAGWTQTHQKPLDEVLNPMFEAGLTEILCTDISRDGMMAGPNTQLYIALQHRFPKAKFIASGGVASNEDLTDLDHAGLFACVVGRAWLEGEVDIYE